MKTLNRLLLETSADPEHLIDLVKVMAMELSLTDEADDTPVESMLHDFYLAMDLAEKLCQTSQEKSRLESVLDNMPMSMLILTPDMEIQGWNRKAKQLLNHGSHLQLQNNRLQVLNPQSQRQLEACVNQLIQSKSLSSITNVTSLNIAATDEKLGFIPCYLYQHKHFDFNQQRYVNDICLLINDSQDDFKNHAIEHYAAHHNLSEAETDILHQLVAGRSLNEIAEYRKVSIHTTRTQLKAILKKTGTARQAKLIQQALAYTSIDETIHSDPRLQATHDKFFTLKDGRQLSYREFGEEFDTVVVLCHGMITCRLDPVNPDIFAGERIRLIIPDRPGYGLSDPPTGYSLSGWVEDLLELMDGLSISEFSIMAADFSSAYALTAAYIAPSRVAHVLLLEGAAPVDKSNVKYETNIPAFYKFMFFASQNMPKLVHKALYVTYTYYSKNPDKAIERIIDIIGDHNRQIIQQPHIYDRMLEAAMESTRQGSTALASNQILMFSDWKLPLENINVPVMMFVGEADTLARYHNEHLQKKLPNKRVVAMPGKGWASMMYQDMGNILNDWQTLSFDNYNLLV